MMCVLLTVWISHVDRAGHAKIAHENYRIAASLSLRNKSEETQNKSEETIGWVCHLVISRALPRATQHDGKLVNIQLLVYFVEQRT